MTERAKHAARIRDQRQSRDDPRPPSGSGKNTKRWCRGKVGREHKPECRSYNEVKRVTFAPEWKLLICSECGKELDFWMPSRFFKKDRPAPMWACSQNI